MAIMISRSNTCIGSNRRLACRPVRTLSLGSSLKDVQINVLERKREGSVERKVERENKRSKMKDDLSLVKRKNDQGEQIQENTLKETKGIKQPFRDPRLRYEHTARGRSSLRQLEQELARLNDGERILRNRMVHKVEKAMEKWVEAGREAAEYLWQLVGQEGLAESQARPVQPQMLEWGFESQTAQAPMNGWGFDQTLSVEDKYSEAGEEEDLPSVEEMMSEAASLRRYDANGHADSIQSRAKPAVCLISEPKSETLVHRQERNVGWMMQQMGIDPSLFGWKEDEEDWES